MESNELINQFNERDEIAFKLIFKALYQQLVYWACSFTHDIQESEDIVSDVFYKIWIIRISFNDYNHIKNYLHQSVKNECLNHKKYLERKERRINKYMEGRDIDTSVPKSDKADKLIACINSLPEQYKRLILYVLQGYSTKEICEMDGLKENTVFIQRHRAIKLLKSLLNK